MSDEAIKPQKKFMVIEVPVSVDEDGKVKYAQEVLIEGDIVERNGNRFRVVRNEHGALYKQSLDMLGQVGEIKKMTPAEYTAQLRKAAKEQLEMGIPDFLKLAGESFVTDATPLSEVARAMVNGEIEVVTRKTNAGELMELSGIMAEMMTLMKTFSIKLQLLAKRVNQEEGIELDLHGRSRLSEEQEMARLKATITKNAEAFEQLQTEKKTE
jgi:hypothetical protein